MRKFPTKPIPGDAADPQSLTAMLARYLLWMEVHHYSIDTVSVRRLTLSLFIQWCLDRGMTQTPGVTREVLERYQRHLYHYRTRNGERLALASQRHWLTALRSWFAWLTRQRLILVNPASELELPKEEHRLPRHALAASEAEAVLERPDITRPLGLRDRAMLETFYSTGIRRKELARLELSDIDRERRTLLIRQGKGRKDRVVPIGDRALAWIDKYLRECRPKFVHHGGCAIRDPSQHVLFLTRTGRSLHPNHLSALVRGYVQGAGTAKRGACHLFRHTTATLMHENGADIRHIQALLGHSRLDTTQIYTQVSIKKLREVHERTHPAHLKPKENNDQTQ